MKTKETSICRQGHFMYCAGAGMQIANSRALKLSFQATYGAYIWMSFIMTLQFLVLYYYFSSSKYLGAHRHKSLLHKISGRSYVDITSKISSTH